MRGRCSLLGDHLGLTELDDLRSLCGQIISAACRL
jgi:hypothetical protein